MKLRNVAIPRETHYCVQRYNKIETEIASYLLVVFVKARFAWALLDTGHLQFYKNFFNNFMKESDCPVYISRTGDINYI